MSKDQKEFEEIEEQIDGMAQARLMQAIKKCKTLIKKRDLDEEFQAIKDGLKPSPREKIPVKKPTPRPSAKISPNAP